MSYWRGVILGFLMGLSFYKVFWHDELINDGMVQVASGKYECTLETKEDKTTEWVCGETE